MPSVFGEALGSTVEELKQKGVEFTRDIAQERWGLMMAFRLPGGGEIALYEPRHPRPPSAPGLVAAV